MSEKARKEHLRFHSKDPHVVFDVKKGTDKKQVCCFLLFVGWVLAAVLRAVGRGGVHP